MYETTAGGGCGSVRKLQTNLYPKSVKHGFSSAYLLIFPGVLYDKYRVNDLDH